MLLFESVYIYGGISVYADVIGWLVDCLIANKTRLTLCKMTTTNTLTFDSNTSCLSMHSRLLVVGIDCHFGLDGRMGHLENSNSGLAAEDKT